MTWWLWLAVGLLLVGFELAAPGGFFIIFFGVGALAVGVLAAAGLGGPLWTQGLLFSVLSIVSLLLFRNPLLRRMRVTETSSPAMDTLAGELAIPLEDLAPGAVGRAELRGSVWQARNGGSQPIGKGQRCRVLRAEGLMLWIQPEGVV
jgi:membrane protein implicated in regulation of membrane protease activity